MVKHTQTIHRKIADELVECVWPFCEIGTKRVKSLSWFRTCFDFCHDHGLLLPFQILPKNSFMWSSKLETAFSVRRKLVKNTRKHKINCRALVLYMIKSVTQTHSSIYASDMFHSFLACLKGSRQGSNWSW